MVVWMWRIRESGDEFDPYEAYRFAPNLFSLKIHHSGKFTKFPGRRYVNASISYIDVVDADAFSVHERNAMFLELGYPPDEVIYYNFRLPDKDLDFGMLPLGNDSDVIHFLRYVGRNKLMEIYTEHWESLLNTYEISGPSNVVIEEYIEPVPRVLTLPWYTADEVNENEKQLNCDNDQVDEQLNVANEQCESVSRPNKEGCWVVKTYQNRHSCLQTRDVRLCTVSFLAKQIQPIVSVNPTIPLKALQEQLSQKFQIQLSRSKVFRAKTMAIEKLEGDFAAQYGILRDYCEELRRANPNTTIKIEVEASSCNPNSDTRQFKRIYICLGPLKAGFKMSGRDLIGLDGTFMKGPFPGQLLTAVGVDANNGIYPIAYALVEAETLNSWTWFLENLGDDLDISSNSNFTFVSDRQKGIIPALHKVFPIAEHRYCLRHIHENMKSNWKGEFFKNMLWKCASVTTVPHFETAMNEVLKVDKKLHEWLRKIPANHWSRSHFSGRSTCDLLINNICEVFNRQLIGGRDKPIITCLEFVREYLMRRIGIVHKLISKCDGPLTPNATKLFDKIKSDASFYTVLWSGNNKYQVNGGTEQYVVNVQEKTCSCRKWELTGMPCRHGVAVIWNMRENGMDVGIAEDWVSKVYWLQTWKEVYENTIDPINGRDMWMPSTVPTKLTPPKHHKQIGRPKKKRKKAAEEVTQPVVNGKMARVGQTVTCAKCGQKGHNKRSCKGQPSSTTQN